MKFLMLRLSQMGIILFVLSVFLFVVMLNMPGNPVDLLITSNPRIKAEDVLRLKRLKGLDQPWYVQYTRWMVGYYEPPPGVDPLSPEAKKLSKTFRRGFVFILLGDTDALGFSSTYKRPVWDLLKGRIANTLALMIPALLFSLLIALPLGILSAYRQHSWLDYILNFLAFVGISLPVFWFAIMILYLFAERLQWLPAGGIETPGIWRTGDWSVILKDRLEHAVLPIAVLSIAYVGRWLRYMRAAMLEVLPADYIRTARAKGLQEGVVLLKHALRNALIPIVTILAISVPVLFGGAVLTETVFSWPGIGRLEYDAVANNDYYVAIVVFLILAFLVMLGNLLADTLYRLIDPRMRQKS